MTSPTSTIEVNDYSKGFNSYLSNDKFAVRNGESNLLRLAQDARIPTLGDYETRRGFDFHSDAAGLAQDQVLTTATGAADKSFSSTVWLAQKFTASATGRLTKLDLNLKNDASATGVVIAAIYSDNAGSPGTLAAWSSIPTSNLTSSYAYNTFRFAAAPAVTSSTSYWIVVYVQTTGTGSFKWSSTTAATTAKSSSDSGGTWASTSYALNFKQYYATAGGAKGIFRAYKTDGTKVTLMVQGTTLYKVNNSTGALTAIKTGLNASASRYRFILVNDVVYYVNGYDGYRKWDFTTETQINSTNYSDLIVHKGLVFGVRVDDPNRLDYSNFGIYETFTSTDFIDVPAPKTGDPITSVNSLNGYLLIRTQNHCYIFSGDDNATFRLDSAPDQKGTFTPDTSCTDKNYVYFASDDGVYRSNGTQPVMISEAIYADYKAIINKSSITMQVSQGRLYMWFQSPTSGFNDRCYVWNLNFGSGGEDCVESLDTDAFVGHAVCTFADSNALLVASSIVGQVFWQELSTNDHDNLGGPINFLLQTHYLTGHSPAVLKEYRHWKPRFGAQSANYNIDCDYAYDQRDNWTTYSNRNVQGAGSIWGASTTVWGSFTWGTTAEIQADLYIPGEYRRVAVRYKHYAARQPVQFLGHSFVIQTRRIR